MGVLFMFTGFLFMDKEEERGGWGGCQYRRDCNRQTEKEREGEKTSCLVRNNIEVKIQRHKEKKIGCDLLFSLYSLWLTARAQACIWWITKRWESKEVESLTDSKSSSPFWQECRRRRRRKKKIKRKKRCKMKAMSAEGRMHWLQWKWDPSSRELGCAGGCMTHANEVPSRCWQTKPQRDRKTCFPSIEYVSVLHFKCFTTLDSCHSEFGNQFSKSELHGGLAEEPGLMCRVVVTFRIIQ